MMLAIFMREESAKMTKGATAESGRAVFWERSVGGLEYRYIVFQYVAEWVHPNS